MSKVKCGNCEKPLKSAMEIEYSRWINEFFCSPDCATDRYFNYMESTPVDKDSPMPLGVEFVDGFLVPAPDDVVEGRD